ncbi:unnamed protein product [Camellia sinensis]
MGGADPLIYLLRPKSTPIRLSTRGAAIPSVSTNLAVHYLTQLPAYFAGSSATGVQHHGRRHPGCTSCPSVAIAELRPYRARLYSGEVELRKGHNQRLSFRASGMSFPAEPKACAFWPSNASCRVTTDASSSATGRAAPTPGN